jgi:L-ascorbate metabolism protein UlaG (beta-lactamase superfamily)
MKKFLLRAGVVLLVLLIVLLAAAFWSDRDAAVVTRFVKNENLPTIKPGWPGNPIDQDDRFMNDEHPFLPKMLDLLKWTLDSNPYEEEKERDTARLEVKDPTEFLQSDKNGILWLGHASFFVRLDGVSILIDPIFGKPPLVKEFVSVPSPLEKIRAVDYVLLTHDHRDHMDETTLTAIARKFPNARFLAGLRSQDVLGEWSTPTNTIGTAGWFQQFALPDERVKIFFLPVRHWSRRGLFDTNQRLWGGYIIQSKNTTIYHGGDSGYGRHYKETGELFPQIDYFLLGIGAYEPRWFMEPNHNNPQDAIKAFLDSGAKTLVPMHYGRFDLSDEPPNLPLKTLMREAEKQNLTGRIRVLTINDNIVIE